MIRNLPLGLLSDILPKLSITGFYALVLDGTRFILHARAHGLPVIYVCEMRRFAPQRSLPSFNSLLLEPGTLDLVEVKGWTDEGTPHVFEDTDHTRFTAWCDISEVILADMAAFSSIKFDDDG